MQRLKALALGGAVSAVLAAGMWAGGATSASAEVVCNQWNECWHVHNRLDYPGGVGIAFHDDGWRGPHVHWRANHFGGGNGYYRNGVWIRF